MAMDCIGKNAIPIVEKVDEASSDQGKNAKLDASSDLMDVMSAGTHTFSIPSRNIILTIRRVILYFLARE